MPSWGLLLDGVLWTLLIGQVLPCLARLSPRDIPCPGAACTTRSSIWEALGERCSIITNPTWCEVEEWCTWEAATPPPPDATFQDAVQAVGSIAWPACLQDRLPGLIGTCLPGTDPTTLLPLPLPPEEQWVLWNETLSGSIQDEVCSFDCAQALQEVGAGCLRGAANMVCSLAAVDSVGGLLDVLLSQILSLCVPEEGPWGCDYEGYCHAKSSPCPAAAGDEATCLSHLVAGEAACSFGPMCSSKPYEKIGLPKPMPD